MNANEYLFKKKDEQTVSFADGAPRTPPTAPARPVTGFESFEARAESLVELQRLSLEHAKALLYARRDPRHVDYNEMTFSFLKKHVPLEECSRLNERLLAEHGRYGIRSSTQGAPQSDEDKATHLLFKTMLQLDFAHVLVAGEEADEHDWALWLRAAAGAVLFLLDAIDGTKPFENLLAGYSSNLLTYLRDADGRTRLKACHVVTGGGDALVWIGDGAGVLVSSGRTDPLAQLMELGRRDFALGTVAVVAAAPDARGRALALLSTQGGWGLPPRIVRDTVDEDPSLTVYTLGGVPATLGLAISTLGALVYTDAQTVHDAAGVPALLALGCVCIGEDGEELDPRHVLGLFDDPVAPGSPGYQRIPKMVITRPDEESRRLGRLMANRLWHREQTDPPTSAPA